MTKIGIMTADRNSIIMMTRLKRRLSLPANKPFITDREKII